jgi:hypothetical protein
VRYHDLDVTQDWTAVQDQLQADARAFLAQPGLKPEVRAWVEEAVGQVRGIVATDFVGLDPDVVRRVIVRGGAILGVLLQAVDPECTQTLGLAQTVLAVALFGDPR